MPIDSSATASRVFESRTPPQPRVVVASTLIFSTALVDTAFGAAGGAMQFVMLGVAVLLLRREISSVLANRFHMGIVFVIVVVLIFGLAVGERLSFTPPTAEFGLRLMLFTVLSLVLGIVAATKPDFRDSFATGIALAGAFSAVLVVLGFAAEVQHVESGRSIAIGLAVLPFVSAFSSHSAAVRLTLFGFMAFVAFQTGARAPLLFSLVSIVLALLLLRSNDSLRASQTRRMRLLAVSIVAIAAFSLTSGLVPLDNLEGGAARQAELLQARSVRDIASLADRIDRAYVPSLESIDANLVLGRGLPADVDSGVGYLYPHNFVLELGFSYGISGILLAALVLSLALRGAMRSLHSDPSISALILYVVLSAQISGDIVANRLIFFAAGYGLMIGRRSSSSSEGRFSLRR